MERTDGSILVTYLLVHSSLFCSPNLPTFRLPTSSTCLEPEQECIWGQGNTGLPLALPTLEQADTCLV